VASHKKFEEKYGLPFTLLSATFMKRLFLHIQMAANPFSRSAMMSSICSVPMESLMVLWEIPWSSSSASESCEWVVDAGWITRLFTSATLARRENISRLSMNFHAASFPPFISNVKMEAPPLGKYFL